MNPKADGRYDYIFVEATNNMLQHSYASSAAEANLIAIASLEVQVAIANELGRIADSLDQIDWLGYQVRK